MTFQELALSAPILKAVTEKGYTRPTPIQAEAIPPALAGRDIMGCAQTGTGKTAAFTLPILQLLAADPHPGRRPVRALVLTPTRELAIQIDACCRDYACHTSLRHTVIFGGVNQRPQVEALRRGVDLLIATPGRLLDLIGQGLVSLADVRFFVLDEADRMLDMGFIHDIRRILPLLPRERQTLFFSATMPEEIVRLSQDMLRDPVRISVTPPASVVETIRQSVRFVAKADKKDALAGLLRERPDDAALVFSRTKHGADRIARLMTRAGIEARAIHGDKSQGAREKAMNDFRSGASRVLIATDIAARGIDITELPLVVNYDLPEVAETYVHRIGRTGRAGCAGEAVSFCSDEERPLLAEIEKLTGQRVVAGEEHDRATLEIAPAEPRRAASAARKGGSKAGGTSGSKTASASGSNAGQHARSSSGQNPVTNRRNGGRAAETEAAPDRSKPAPAHPQRQAETPAPQPRRRNRRHRSASGKGTEAGQAAGAAAGSASDRSRAEAPKPAAGRSRSRKKTSSAPKPDARSSAAAPKTPARGKKASAPAFRTTPPAPKASAPKAAESAPRRSFWQLFRSGK